MGEGGRGGKREEVREKEGGREGGSEGGEASERERKIVDLTCTLYSSYACMWV